MPVRAAGAPTIVLSSNGSTISAAAGASVAHLATVRAPGIGSSTLTDILTGAQQYTSGSFQTPAGATAQWSTDAGVTWMNTEPQSGVTAIRAQVTSGPSSSVSLTPVSTTSSLTPQYSNSTTNGDGWSAIRYGTNIYDVFHHAGPKVTNFGRPYLSVYCASAITGATCPGYPGGLSTTPGTGLLGAADPAYNVVTTFLENPVLDASGAYGPAGRLYFFAAQVDPAQVNGSSGGSVASVDGVLCFDITTARTCGWWPMRTGWAVQTANFGLYPDIDGAAVIGTRMYGSAADGSLYWFDLTAKTSSSFVGFTGAGGTISVGDFNADSPPNGEATYAYGGQVWTLESQPNATTAGSFLSCFDPGLGGACAGWATPIRLGADLALTPANAQSIALLPLLAADGGLLGVCSPLRPGGQLDCFTTGGAPTTLPAAEAGPLTAALATYSPGGLVQLQPLVLGPRMYLPETNTNSSIAHVSQIQCLDASIPGPCAGFGTAGIQLYPLALGFAGGDAGQFLYSVTQDPYLPGCAWADGDAGVIDNVNLATGQSCAQQTARASASLDAGTAASWCDGQNHITAWSTLTVTGLPAGPVAGAPQGRLSITDGSGAPVAGYQLLPVQNGQAVDLSSIPSTGATRSLRAEIDYPSASAAALSAVFGWATDGTLQLCALSVTNPCLDGGPAGTAILTDTVTAALADGSSPNASSSMTVAAPSGGCAQANAQSGGPAIRAPETGGGPGPAPPGSVSIAALAALFVTCARGRARRRSVAAPGR